MAKSRTRKQRDRRRFTCDWAGQEEALRARQAAQKQELARASGGDGLVHNPIQSARPVSLEGLGRGLVRSGYAEAPVSSAALGGTKRLWPPRPDVRL